MRFESARDALKHANVFHRQLAELYARMAKQETNEKSKILLEYMVQQERTLAKSLEAYEKDTLTGVLDTWFQYANDAAILKLPAIEALHVNQTTDEILNLSIAMSSELIDVYNQVEEQVDESGVKEIFNNLASMQLQKQKRLSINFERLMDA